MRKKHYPVIAVTTIGALTATPSLSHGAVTEKIVNLTTSNAPSLDPADGNIFIDFSTMSASLSALPTYQYRIMEVTGTIPITLKSVSILPTGGNGMLSDNDPDCPAPARLGAGSVIDSSGTFTDGLGGLFGVVGNWGTGERGYVGLRFGLDG